MNMLLLSSYLPPTRWLQPCRVLATLLLTLLSAGCLESNTVCNGIDYKEMPSAIRVVGRSDRVDIYRLDNDDVERRMEKSNALEYSWKIDHNQIIDMKFPSCHNIDEFADVLELKIQEPNIGSDARNFNCDYITFAGSIDGQQRALTVFNDRNYRIDEWRQRTMYTILVRPPAILNAPDDRVLGYIAFSAPLGSVPASTDRVPDTELYRTIGPNGEPPLILMRHWVFPNTPEFADAVSAIGAKPAEEDEWVDCADYYYGYFVK